MNLSVFSFSLHLLMFILKLEGALRWKIENKLTDYGQNLVLMCKVSNCCLEDAGWYVWTPEKRTIFEDVKNVNISALPKYWGDIRTDGFTLIIKNLIQSDVNVYYSCNYGSQLGESIFLYKDDVFKTDDHTEYRLSTVELAILIGAPLFVILLLAVIIICLIKRKQSSDNGVATDHSEGKVSCNGNNKLMIHNQHWQKIEVSFICSTPQKQTDTSFMKVGGVEICTKSTGKQMNNIEIESGESYEVLLEKPFTKCNVHVKYTQTFLYFFSWPLYGHVTLQHLGGNEMIFTKNGELRYTN